MGQASKTGSLVTMLIASWLTCSSPSNAEGLEGHNDTSPQVLNSVKTNQPIIALTFDDGPHPTLTAQLLDILREEQTPATFFVVGRNAQANPALVQRMAQEGHEVGNHTWSHPSLPSTTSTKVDQELSKTSDVIHKLTGVRPQTMRPPYGAMNRRVQNQILDKHGMHIVLWSVDPKDWKKPNVNTIRQRMVAGASPGGIILAHDIHPGTIQAIPHVIQDLKVLGYKFVTIQELLAAKSSLGNTTQIP